MLDKIRWFWKYYRRYPYVLAVLVFLTPVQVAFHVSIPRLIEFSVDYVKSGEVTNAVAIWLVQRSETLGISIGLTFMLTLIILGACSAMLYAFVQSHRAWMNLRLEWLFRQDAFDGVTTKGPNFFNRFRTGDLVTRMTDDVAEKLSWFACSGIFRLYEAVLLVLFTLTMMFMINPTLTLWSAGPLPLLIVIFFKSATILDQRFDHLQTRISRFNDIMEACFSGVRVVMAYVTEKIQKKKFDDAVHDRRDAEISVIRADVIVESLYMYIWQFGIIIVLIAGGYMAIHGTFSLGKLVAFVYYTAILVFPMFDIGQFLVKSRQSAVSIDRLVELEKMPPMVPGGNGVKIDASLQGQLSFENVEFAFPESERKIIDQISLEITPGQTVALVGRVGSGKSWLVNMIPRLVDPTGGAIRLDGRDLRTYSLEDLRKSIGFVPQEPVLFSDTVRNNILFGRVHISDAVMEWAVEVSQLKEEIASFPKGIETQIGTRGVSISGGQKQRLALARALVGKPRILILDDCTSALDSRTEEALWDRLHQVMPDMTAILITHRPDTLRRADMIYVLEDGKVIESGGHHELTALGGQYAKIYRRYELQEQVSK
ncbi:MAG: ABC transporter ATP-binding protein [candidate division Zixibacteria bacterium]|nr:ABC transporter ATP-binding protein [candidate division Zixibacteria bacterium]